SGAVLLGSSLPFSLANQVNRRVPVLNFQDFNFCSLPAASRTISVPSSAGFGGSSAHATPRPRTAATPALRNRNPLVVVRMFESSSDRSDTGSLCASWGESAARSSAKQEVLGASVEPALPDRVGASIQESITNRFAQGVFPCKH